MNKLDRYDANKIIEAKRILSGVHDYNYVPSSSLSKKLNTILDKLEKILNTELEPKLQEEWNLLGRI